MEQEEIKKRIESWFTKTLSRGATGKRFPIIGLPEQVDIIPLKRDQLDRPANKLRAIRDLLLLKLKPFKLSMLPVFMTTHEEGQYYPPIGHGFAYYDGWTDRATYILWPFNYLVRAWRTIRPPLKRLQMQAEHRERIRAIKGTVFVYESHNSATQFEVRNLLDYMQGRLPKHSRIVVYRSPDYISGSLTELWKRTTRITIDALKARMQAL